MEPELFTPSYDWAAAPLDSLLWIGRAWVISAVSLMVALVVLRYATVWGRQFWRITGGYFVGPQSVRVWLMLGVLLLSVVVGVRLDVLLSYQLNDLYTGVQTAVDGDGSRQRRRLTVWKSTVFGCRSSSSASWPPCTSRG